MMNKTASSASQKLKKLKKKQRGKLQHIKLLVKRQRME